MSWPYSPSWASRAAPAAAAARAATAADGRAGTGSGSRGAAAQAGLASHDAVPPPSSRLAADGRPLVETAVGAVTSSSSDSDAAGPCCFFSRN